MFLDFVLLILLVISVIVLGWATDEIKRLRAANKALLTHNLKVVEDCEKLHKLNGDIINKARDISNFNGELLIKIREMEGK